MAVFRGFWEKVRRLGTGDAALGRTSGGNASTQAPALAAKAVQPEMVAPLSTPRHEPAGVTSPDAPSAKPVVTAKAKQQPTTRRGVSSLVGDLADNVIDVGENVVLRGEISGRGNVIRIGATRNPQQITIKIYGNGNRITIGNRSLMQSLVVEVGSRRWHSSRSELSIGSYFSIGSKGRFLLPNSGNVIRIGDNCMFSKSVQLRGGEYPHMVFDRNTGAFLDESDGIFIGDHAWIGESVFIAKAVTIPRDCIVGAHSVVTKRFEDENAVIAGNPAKVVKRGVQWVATEFVLGTDYPDLEPAFRAARMNQINEAEKRADLEIEEAAKAAKPGIVDADPQER